MTVAVGRAHRRAGIEVFNSERNEPCLHKVCCNQCEPIQVAERFRWHASFGTLDARRQVTHGSFQVWKSVCHRRHVLVVLSRHGRHLFLFSKHWSVKHLLSRVLFEHRLRRKVRCNTTASVRDDLRAAHAAHVTSQGEWHHRELEPGREQYRCRWCQGPRRRPEGNACIMFF